MIEYEKREKLLSSQFAHNEEVLVNANAIQQELKQKDAMSEELEALKRDMSRLLRALERAGEQLLISESSKPSYKRFEVRA